MRIDNKADEFERWMLNILIHPCKPEEMLKQAPITVPLQSKLDQPPEEWSIKPLIFANWMQCNLQGDRNPEKMIWSAPYHLYDYLKEREDAE